MLSPNTFEQDVNNTLDPFLETRKKLRETLLIDRILDNGWLLFEGTFDGYGDSGNYYIDTGNTEVDAFLNECLDINVTFDWYNNDGGGGDITAYKPEPPRYRTHRPVVPPPLRPCRIKLVTGTAEAGD